jgi:hypothetical protein
MSRYREALALSIDRAAIHNVLLQKQGEISGALLPQWLSGHAFLFASRRDLARARQLATPPQTLSFAYDRQSPHLRGVAERIVLNAAEANITLRATSADPPDVRLIALPVTSGDAKQAIDDMAVFLKAPPTAPGQELYEAERALLQATAVIPLFHLPRAYQVSSKVQDWSGQLADVWIEERTKP